MQHAQREECQLTLGINKHQPICNLYLFLPGPTFHVTQILMNTILCTFSTEEPVTSTAYKHN